MCKKFLLNMRCRKKGANEKKKGNKVLCCDTLHMGPDGRRKAHFFLNIILNDKHRV